MNYLEKRLSPTNNLGYRYPELAGRWHSTKNGTLKPHMVCPKSKKNVWWICSNGHEHKSNICNMVVALGRGAKSAGCPCCSGDRPTRDNNLAILFPDLSSEWHEEKNVGITPYDVLPQSHARMWWKCKMGHEWQTGIQNRTAKRSGCPKCRLFGSSRFEARVFSEIKHIWPDSEMKKRIIGKECDIVIPSLRVIIEIDGLWWHKDSYHKDEKKTVLLVREGYRVVRMRQMPLPVITDEDICFEESVYHIDSNALDCIKSLVLKIGTWSDLDVSEYVSRREFINDDEYQNILRFFPMPEKGSSLLDRFPDIVKQWHPTKNGKIIPEQLKPRSSKKVWWKCDKGHEWQSSPNVRTYGSGCPYCATGQKICADNNFAVTNSDIAKQWHPTRNSNLALDGIGRASVKKVWWICDKGHEWQAVVKERCRARKIGCPACARVRHSERMKGNDFRIRNHKTRISATA